MAITAAAVKELRERTGAGMMDCKKALNETNGDIEAAVDLLRTKGLAAAQKKSSRTAAEGLVGVSVEGTKGVAVEVNSETDFVAKNDDFKEFAKNIAMQIAATNPLGIDTSDIPEDIINKEKEIYRAQTQAAGKPEKVIEKIVEGKLKKFFSESCLLNQAYVRDPHLTIADLLNDLISKMGENISIKRFVRFQIGES